MHGLLKRPEHTNGVIQLVACPCGYEFGPVERRFVHFERDHRPEDFGLSPMSTKDRQARLGDYRSGSVGFAL